MKKYKSAFTDAYKQIDREKNTEMLLLRLSAFEAMETLKLFEKDDITARKEKIKRKESIKNSS